MSYFTYSLDIYKTYKIYQSFFDQRRKPLNFHSKVFFIILCARKKKKIERKNFTIINDYFVISINFSNLFDQPRYTRREQLAWQEIRRAIKDNYSVEGSWLRMPRQHTFQRRIRLMRCRTSVPISSRGCKHFAGGGVRFDRLAFLVLIPVSRSPEFDSYALENDPHPPYSPPPSSSFAMDKS